MPKIDTRDRYIWTIELLCIKGECGNHKQIVQNKFSFPIVKTSNLSFKIHILAFDKVKFAFEDNCFFAI